MSLPLGEWVLRSRSCRIRSCPGSLGGRGVTTMLCWWNLLEICSLELAKNLSSIVPRKAIDRERGLTRGILLQTPPGGYWASFWPWDACVSCTLQYLSIGEAEHTAEAWSWRSCQHCRRQRHSSTKTYQGDCMGVGSCWSRGATGYHALQKLSPQKAASAAGTWCWRKPPTYTAGVCLGST